MFRNFVHATISVALVICLNTTSDADIVVTVSDNGSHLRFEWNGNLQINNLPQAAGTFPGTFNWMTPSLGRMHGLTGMTDFYDFQSLVLAPYGTGNDFLVDGVKTGDSFGLTIPSGNPNEAPARLYVPTGYTNQTLFGSVTFTGATMASQGIDLSMPVVYDFGSVGTVTFQGGPWPTILGDVNLDGVVTFLDIAPFISLLAAGGFQEEADIDQNGVVDFLDIAALIDILSAAP